MGIHSSWLLEVPTSALEDVVLVDVDGGGVSAFEVTARAARARALDLAASHASGWASPPPPTPPPPASLPKAVARNFELLLRDLLALPDFGHALPTDALLVAAPVKAPVATKTPLRSARPAPGSSPSAASEPSTAARSSGVAAAVAAASAFAAGAAAVFEVRMAFAAQFACMLAGFEQCVFWVDAGWPVFDEARFLEDFSCSADAPALTQLLATQTFHQLLENFDEPSLAVFHQLVARTDVAAKLIHGCAHAGLSLASHSLAAAPADPATPSSRVAAAADRAARLAVATCTAQASIAAAAWSRSVPRAEPAPLPAPHAPPPPLPGAARFVLEVSAKAGTPASSFTERSLARAVSGSRPFPSEKLFALSSLDAAAAATSRKSVEAFDSAKDADVSTASEPERSAFAEPPAPGGSRFRFKARPLPAAEEADCWTVAAVAAASRPSWTS